MLAGKWTVQQAAEMSVAAPTIEASLDGRFVSGLKDERVKAAKFYEQFGVKAPSQLVSFCLDNTAVQELPEVVSVFVREMQKYISAWCNACCHIDTMLWHHVGPRYLKR